MEVDLQLRHEAEQAVRWMRSCLEEPEAAGKYRKLNCEYCPFDKVEGYCVDNMHIAVAALLEKLLAGGSDQRNPHPSPLRGDTFPQGKAYRREDLAPHQSAALTASPRGEGFGARGDEHRAIEDTGPCKRETDSSSPLTPQNDIGMGEEISAMDYLRSIGAIKDDGR